LSNQPTIDIAPVRQWFEIFAAYGVDRISLLAILGCQEPRLRERDARVLICDHHAMLKFGAEASGMPGIALIEGVKTTPDNMGVVGQLMMNCDTLMDAGNQIVRFANLLCESIKWSIVFEGETCNIHYQVTAPELYSVIGAEASLAACIGMLRVLSGQKIAPLSVNFAHPDPGHPQIYAQIFGVPVAFDQADSLISIRLDDANLPIPRHQPYVLDILSKHAVDLLSKLDALGGVTAQVRRLVTEQLGAGEITIERISAELAMSRWTLSRRLKEEGTTFNKLVRALRCELAREYLNSQQLSISEVSFLLGYSEPSAFQRAFRGWYQCSPTEFRAMH
jgi:AraC-like DNA-binding protein